MALTYKEDEVCLSYHGPFLYEAKIRAVDHTAEKPYFVHYKGWNANWDEWVGLDRLVKFDEAGLQKQKDLVRKFEEEQQSKRGGGGGGKKRKGKKEADDDDNDDAKAKKAKKKAGKKKRDDEDDSVEPESESKRQEIKLVIPGQLKKKLVNDWEQINRKQKLVVLPRQPSVSQILNEFLESKKAKKPEQQKVVKEIMDGLKVYFDRALGTSLLYRFERPQYEEQVKNNGKDQHMSDIYGAEHLLRLIVKLPSLFMHTTLDEDQISILQKNLGQFIVFLQKSSYFGGDYSDPADPEYHSKVEPGASS